MRIGVTAMLTDRTIDPAALARAVEAHGLDGLYLPEHTHVPVAAATPHPLEGETPEPYRRVLDPFVALAVAAAVTERIRLGTSVALLPARDPILTAKEVATLDHLSGGRVVLGVGHGWLREELADHHVAWSDRRAATADKVAVMRALWADEPTGYTGEHAQVPPSHAWPKPIHGPVPVLLGVGSGPVGLAEVAAWADGWMPNGASGVAAALPRLHAACEDVGRDPATVEVVVAGSLVTAGKLDHLAGLGVDEVLALIPDPTTDTVPRALAALTDEVARWGGHRSHDPASAGRSDR